MISEGDRVGGGYQDKQQIRVHFQLKKVEERNYQITTAHWHAW